MTHTARNHNKPWTLIDTAKMLCMYSFLSIDAVAEVMGRTKMAIYARAHAFANKQLVRDDYNVIRRYIKIMTDDVGNVVDISTAYDLANREYGDDKKSPGLPGSNTKNVESSTFHTGPSTIGKMLTQAVGDFEPELKGAFLVHVVSKGGILKAHTIMHSKSKQELERSCTQYLIQTGDINCKVKVWKLEEIKDVRVQVRVKIA